MTDQETIAAELSTCSTVLVSTHKNPDGDALGSELALMLALEGRGKSVTIHNLDPVPEIYRFLPASERVRSGPAVEGTYDCLVVVDCEPGRTGLFNGAYPARTLINIDHHITNSREWPLTWLDTQAAATGEMVYRLVRKLGVPIEGPIAHCLFTSIFTDTGSFRYTNTTPESMRIAADLLAAGADPWLVTENVYESFAFPRIKFLGNVLAGMERSKDGTIAWVVITEDQYRTYGTSAEDTENFINFVRAVKGVEVAILLRQTGPAQYKISFRSKGRADVSGVATSLGGGGHKNAAGAVLDGTLDEVLSRVVAETAKAIDAKTR